MENMPDRLKQLIKEKGIKPVDFGNAIGINNSTVSRVLSGSQFPNPETLYKMSKFFDVTMEYIMTGEEKCCACADADYYKNPTEKFLIESFRHLNDDEQEEIIGIIKIKLEKLKRDKKINSKSSIYIQESENETA